MKLQFTILNCIIVLFLSLITITLSAQDKPSLIKKSDSNQSLFHRNYNLNNSKKTNSSLELNTDSNNKKSISQGEDTEWDDVYFEVPVGVMRTITSRGDYGNVYFIGFGVSAIYKKFDFSLIFFSFGWGRTKEGIQYYHETLEAGSKTFGGYALKLDLGYNISPIKKIRFSPTIGLNVASFTEITSGNRSGNRNRGVIKYDIGEKWIPQVGFDAYYRLPDGTSSLLLKLKYRYNSNISKKGKFVKDVSIYKHIITLGINFRPPVI